MMMRLETTPEEVEALKEAKDWMVAYMMRLALPGPERPFALMYEKRPEDAKKVDQVIAGGVSRLKTKVKVSFFEKLYEYVADETAKDPTDFISLIFIRFMDTLGYVISYTKKFRGEIITPPYDRKTAEATLIERGLIEKSRK